MEKITDKIRSLPPEANYFSLEFFPPKTEAGFSNLCGRLARMSLALRPLFVTVTWGAGGSTATKSLELAEVCQHRLGLTTCLHLTCTNMSRALVHEAVNQAKALGIRNILALRGDAPRSGEYGLDGQENSNKDFTWAIDLVRYLRKVHGDHFCIGVAGYPEGHADGSHPECQSVEQDLSYLVAKVMAGADFIMTQIVYDMEAFAKYESTLRSHCSGAFASMPIIPGLMPIQSYQIVKRITHLSHVRLPLPISARIEVVKADDEAVKRAGVDILSEMINDVKALPRPGPLARGFHFYTLNLEKSVASILDRCELIPILKDSRVPSIVAPDSTITFPPAVNVSGMALDPEDVSDYPSSPISVSWADSQSSTQSPTRTARSAKNQDAFAKGDDIMAYRTADTGAKLARDGGESGDGSSRVSTLFKPEGGSPLGQEATWDDYPNGRWGPSSSPAFGEIDGYGPSLKVGPATARQLWKHPKSYSDITNLFQRHVQGGLVSVPWSDETNTTEGGALQAETETIKPELLWLIEKRGFWTLASQPAVDGVRNDDEVFGWGPPGGGLVYQKPFVEFFMPRKDWENELKSQLKRHDNEEISWFKTDSGGMFESSYLPENLVDPRSDRPRAGRSYVPAVEVTWGVFRGKERVTPTIIGEESFCAWGDEAYGIWEQWRRIFPEGSKEEMLLDSCQRDTVLVNVVGHQFAGTGGKRLWEILRGE